jgi:NAD(P)H-hydrate epimerase
VRGGSVPFVRVTTAAESADADRAAIAAGTPGRALMQRAGAAAAGEIVRRYPHLLGTGVAVHCGPGNNGGDGWVVAAALRRFGVRVRAVPWGGGAPHTDDARFEFDRAWAAGACGPVTGSERLVVDAVLGTGARPPARDHALAYARHLADEGARVAAGDAASGRVVVALDVPSGLDATTGDEIGLAVRADLTLTFGTLKRGLLVRRDLAGTIAVLDIGLGEAEGAVGEAPVLYDPTARLSAVAGPIPAGAHKGTRGKVVVVGGAPGMAGAAILACDAALRSGAGMVRAVVAPESLPAVQSVLPAAMAAVWSTDDGALASSIVDWADAVVLGPGLGTAPAAAALVDRVLAAWRGPTVLDADALNHFAARPEALAAALGARPALLTPHPVEFARLAAVSPEAVLAGRFDVGRAFAARVGAAVLLKGVPTVVSDARGATVVASGTPALATAGSGDVLSGIAAALMVGPGEPDGAAVGAAAAWVHGRAGELATARRGGVRGTTLADVLDALQDAWPRPDAAGGFTSARAPYPVLAELPAVPG